MSARPLPAEIEALARAAGLEEAALHGLGRLRLTGISDLDLLARTHRLRDAPGLGLQVERRLLGALTRGQGWVGPRLLDAGRAAASRLLGGLQRESTALRLAVAGAVRRMDPTCERVDLVATAHDPQALLAAFTRLPAAEQAVAEGPNWREVRLADGLAARLTVLPEDAGGLGALLLLGTGPPSYGEALARRARERGLRLEDDGLHAGEARIPATSEEEVLARLELPYRPPELRGRGSAEEPPPQDLLRMTDLRGLFHVHTRRGHGTHGLADMVDRASREGYAWMAVTDRARPEAAGALTPADVEEAREEGRRARRRAEEIEGAAPLDLLVGTEAAVLPDGTLDAPADLLEAVDLCVAVVDAPDGEDVTERTLAALRNPKVRVLGRPEGRVLLGRSGPRLDVPAVLEACSAHGVAVEVNGDPHRLTLDSRWHEAAQHLGVSILVGADAHDLGGIDQAILGVGCARRGGWRRGAVLNTLDAGTFRRWCRGAGSVPTLG